MTSKEHYWKNREYLLAWRKEDRKKYPEKYKEYQKKRRLRDKERNKKFDREHYLRYKESYAKQYKEKSETREYKEYRKKYVKENTVTFKIYSNKRRIVTKFTDIDAEWLNELWDKSKKCCLCECKMDNNGRKYPNGKQLDHILPVSVGGTHTKDNVRFICIKCNLERPKDGSDILQLLHASI